MRSQTTKASRSARDRPSCARLHHMARPSTASSSSSNEGRSLRLQRVEVYQHKEDEEEDGVERCRWP